MRFVLQVYVVKFALQTLGSQLPGHEGGLGPTLTVLASVGSSAILFLSALLHGRERVAGGGKRASVFSQFAIAGRRIQEALLEE